MGETNAVQDMKLSEFKAVSAPQEAEDALPYRRSEIADPPITTDEARAADIAVCRMHKGLIAESPTPSDTEGRVYFCPIGKTYWRYSKRANQMYAPLRYRW
jgi:hypothetical protein